MLQLMVPVRHEWLTHERGYGKLVIEPFEPGFALTVGTAYRRVLLSSIHGAVPTWAKIEGVLHEFSYLQGVNEDILDIIMNLRKVVFALHVNRPKILRLKAQGPRTVTAGHFEPDADVDVLMPDVRLATLDKDGSLEMELCVERGRGYQAAERRALLDMSTRPEHVFGNDADSMSAAGRGLDPRVNVYSLSTDPIGFASRQRAWSGPPSTEQLPRSSLLACTQVTLMVVATAAST